MLGNKRPLPSPENGSGELSRPQKRRRTLLLSMREELCLGESLGRIHFETSTVYFRLLQVRLVSMVKTLVSEELNKALRSLYAPPRVIPSEAFDPSYQLKFLDQVDQPVYTTIKVKRQNSEPRDTGLRMAVYLNNEKITQGPLASAKIEEQQPACVLNWGDERVKEGITEPFQVLDRHMAVRKKHHPPVLSDEVWRLEGIGTKRCESLNQNNIHTVKDLLELYLKNEATLREILGVISETSGTWKTIICHAKQCTDLVDCNGALNQSNRFPKIPSISSAHFTCNNTYIHGTSSSQLNPLEHQIINEDVVARVSGHNAKLQGCNSENLLDHENVVEHQVECDNLVQARYNALNSETHPQQVSMHEQTNTINPVMDQNLYWPVNNNTSQVSPLEVLHERNSLPDQFCTSSEGILMLEKIAPLQTNGAPIILGTDTSVLNVGPMICSIAGVFPIEIPMDLDPMEDLFANVESTRTNSSHFPSRSNSFDSGSCDALVQDFIASMSSSEHVGPLTPRRGKKIGTLFTSIRFLASLRKRTRIVHPTRQTIVLGC